MSKLKSLRIEKKLTQQQVADLMGISLRSYKSYENDEEKIGTLKYNYIIEKLAEINPIDENHGIVDVDYIRQKCQSVFEGYEIEFCYLFGSYAKGKATPESDVDLLISTGVGGLKFYGLVEEIRAALHKKVDVLNMEQLMDNPELMSRITKELYPGIAHRFGTTSSKVERAIRHAIEVAWNRGRIDALDEAFGKNVCALDDKPTNGEFIALVADRLGAGKSA